MIIDGRDLAKKYYPKLSSIKGKKVCFISFLSTPASESFIKIKSKVAEELGVSIQIERKDALNTQEAVESVKKVSETCDGVIVQLPLPKELNTQEVLNAIPIEKDVDVLSDAAKEAFKTGEKNIIPPVAWAVWHILEANNVDLSTKEILILGKGKLVGEPVAMILDRNSISYSQVDINTDDQEKYDLILNADVIISGIGNAQSITGDMIKEGAILIDAGTSEDAGVLKGDFHPNCAEKSSLFTPVPGGVGPLTVIGLYSNLGK